jgi:hypothetical protein
MAKLSVSVPDDVAAELRAKASANVSAFVSTAIRHELDRRRLVGFLDELEEELGPPDEDEVARYQAVFAETFATTPSPAQRKRTPAKK